MKGVIYARYSSHNQREESIEGQLRECTAYAEKNGISIINTYIDRALSGKTDNRPDFQRMIRDSAKGKFDCVILYTVDRFARNRYDSAVYKARLKRNGVRVFYAKQEISDEPEGIILESMLEGYAEYYSANLSRGVKRGMHENALKAKAMGKMPLGFKQGKDHSYEIEPVGAKTVQVIFEKYSCGWSRKQICDYLNENGYKTATGKEFNKNSLTKILSNTKYIGTYTFAEVTLENAIPAIIDKELFDRVQSLIKHNSSARAKNKATVDYLLSGKVFCGHCGEPMIGESGKSKTGAVHRYYKCAGRKRQHNCNKKTEKKDVLEQVVVQETIKHVLTDDNIERISSKAMEIISAESKDNSLLEGLKAELKDTKRKIRNMVTAIEEGIITPTTKERMDELEDARVILESRIAKEEIKKPFITKEHIQYWLYSFKNGSVDSPEYQRSIIDTLVNSVFVYDDDDGNGRSLLITFNISGDNTIKLKSSDIESLGIPNSANPNVFIKIKHCFGFFCHY